MHYNFRTQEQKTGFGIVGIIIIIAAIAVLGGGFFGYQYLKLQKIREEATMPAAESLTPPPVSTETQPKTNEIDTSNWKTYRNEKYGFEVRYPRIFKNHCNEGALGGDGTQIGSPNYITDELCGILSLDGISIHVKDNPKKLSLSKFVANELIERGFPSYPFVVRSTFTELGQSENGIIDGKDYINYSITEIRTLLAKKKGKAGYIRFNADKVIYFDYFSLSDEENMMSENILSTFKFIK